MVGHVLLDDLKWGAPDRGDEVRLSVTEYLVERAVADAERTVEAHHAVRLHSTARWRFLAALDHPGPPRELLEQVHNARPLTYDG